jgi:hypothetical protein
MKLGQDVGRAGALCSGMLAKITALEGEIAI